VATAPTHAVLVLTAGLLAVGHRIVHGGDRFTGPTLVYLRPDVLVLDEPTAFSPRTGSA
jgi:acetate kinase